MSVDPKLKAKLSKLRAKIDAIDEKLLTLLNERARVAIDVGEAKREGGASFYAPSREEDLVRTLQGKNTGPFPSSAIRPVWKEIMSASLSLEAPLRVAYFGPQATFTHQACLKHFGLSAMYIPVRTIGDVFDYVEKGKADFGVIPVENTTEGSVSNTLDKFFDAKTKIVGEVMLRISLNLMNKSGSRGDIQKIYSHAHALPQCRNWLEANMPDIPALEAPSTAQAARMAAEDETLAAVAGQLAGELYGLLNVETSIEDNPSNFTRFLVIGREIPDPGPCNKTSLLFAVKDQAGALYHMLRPFYDNSVNLTKIESRPMKRKAWEYVFFLDCEGHVGDPALKKAIEGLEKVCQFVKVLGSYPCGERPE